MLLPSLRAILSHRDNISSMSYEILRSTERGKLRFKETSLGDPHHRERRIYSALREIDHVYQAKLVACIGERELHISSALSGPWRHVHSSTATTTTSRSSRSSPDKKYGIKEERRNQTTVDKEVMTASCNLEIVVPDKERGEVADKQNYLAICAPSTVENLPSNSSLTSNRNPILKFPVVKPPWITSLTTYPPRYRKPWCWVVLFLTHIYCAVSFARLMVNVPLSCQTRFETVLGCYCSLKKMVIERGNISSEFIPKYLL